MRAFVVLGHKASLDPGFTLNDLPGGAGRLDVLCRCVNAALFLSHDMRRDVSVFLVLQDQLTVRIHGQHVKRLNPDERSTAALIKKALERVQHHEGRDELRSTPGISVARRGLEGVLETLQREGFEPVWLHESAPPLRQAPLPRAPAFVLSDHQDFSAREEAQLAAFTRLCVGPKVYPASHCIAVVNNELDVRAHVDQGGGVTLGEGRVK